MGLKLARVFKHMFMYYRLKEFEGDLQFLDQLLKDAQVSSPGDRLRLIKHIRSTAIENLPFGTLRSIAADTLPVDITRRTETDESSFRI
jgi:hypothetical protein